MLWYWLKKYEKRSMVTPIWYNIPQHDKLLKLKMHSQVDLKRKLALGKCLCLTHAMLLKIMILLTGFSTTY